MTDFELYAKLIKQHTKHTQHTQQNKQENTCNHKIIIENGSSLCINCGIEISQKLNFEKEWKYYGLNDSKHTSDPNRCYIRKTKDKTIYQDVKHMNISEHIKDTANEIYVQVCGGKVHRGAYRRAIVFASIFHAYKLDKNPQSCESLIKIFNIKRKDALKGLKFISEHAPKNSPIRTIYITPEHLINEFLIKFHVAHDKKKEIIDLYNSVKDKSAILNRSRPQSVGAGIIWFWCKCKKKDITIKDFIKKVGLSELTVNKIAKEIARIKGMENITF